MPRCKAWVEKTDERCKNNTTANSEYCWIHQPKALINSKLVEAAAFSSATIAAIQLWASSKSPDLAFFGELKQDQNPCFLLCRIINKGRKEARNVVISFLDGFPASTKLAFSPEIELSLKKVRVEITEDMHPGFAALYQGFIIDIPLIPANSSIDFVLESTNRDNIRAGKQTVFLARLQQLMVQEFIAAIKGIDSINYYNCRAEAFLRSYLKYLCLFQPAYLIYENERIPVDLYTKDEDDASNCYYNAVSRFKPLFQNVHEKCLAKFDKEKYVAPVYLYEYDGKDISVCRTSLFIPCYLPLNFRLGPKESVKESVSVNGTVGIITKIAPFIKPPQKYDFEYEHTP